jgi:hypothetical protein
MGLKGNMPRGMALFTEGWDMACPSGSRLGEFLGKAPAEVRLTSARCCWPLMVRGWCAKCGASVEARQRGLERRHRCLPGERIGRLSSCGKTLTER